MQELVTSLVKQVEQHIHGRAREEILAKLEQSPTADTMAQIVYDLVMLMDQQASTRGAPLGVDVLMGVATETIDMLIEIMEAMGIKPNVDELREETLIKIILLHMKAVEDDPEEKAAAQELLAELTSDGTMDQVMDHIGQRANMSSEQMQMAGQSMAGPRQNPVAAGVRQGLMNQGAEQ